MKLSLVPHPREGEAREGSVTLSSPVTVGCTPQWSAVVDVFAEDLQRSVGWEVRRVEFERDCDVRLELDATLGPEDFTIRVVPGVEIGASGAPGFAYALTLLRQLGPPQLWSREPAALACWTIPGLTIADGPAFAWRGAHLDVARHFFGVAAVTRLIDLLAAHRMNRLHLHLNDDQGWRIEVPQWPLLTTAGSERTGSPLGHQRDDRRDDVPHGGFYDAVDIATIVAHARRRHVVVVPEIDLPGHAQAVLAAYPQFANTAKRAEVWTQWGISERVLNVDPATIDFAESVVRYVGALFGQSPVHIGGDECPTTEWAQSPAALDIMRHHGFANVGQLPRLYLERLSAALKADGHEVLAWDEVLDAGATSGVTICAWRGIERGVLAAERGFDVVMAPMDYLYFDWLSSASLDEPVAVALAPSITTWEKVYSFEVIPRALHPSRAHHIRGAQVQIWTEYIDSLDRLDYMVFPRLSAFSEVVWGTSGDVKEFRTRLEDHLVRLQMMGVSYRPLDPMTP